MIVGPKKKTIGFVISSMQCGGAERVLSELANHFSNGEYNVVLFLFCGKNEKQFYELNRKIKVIYLDIFSKDYSDFTSRKNLFKYNALTKKMILLKDTLQALRKFRKHIAEQQIDILVSFLDIVNIYTLLACIGLRLPVIVSERTNPNHHQIGFVFSILRMFLYPTCSKLVVQTTSAFKYFPKIFKRFMTIIPNAIPCMLKTKQEHADELTHIVSVGRLSSVKNHSTLIKAFSKYVKAHSQATLTIYGEGEFRNELELLISYLKLEHCIFLPGAVTDVPSSFIDKDLFVFPSLYEGFPNALCEAMSYGLPILASNVSGNNDIIRDNRNGILFDVKDESDLFDKMIFMQDRQTRENLVHEGMITVSKYRVEIIYKLWDEMIKCAE